MQNKSYYRMPSDTDNNFAVDNAPLMVNCTGHSYYTEETRGNSVRRDYYLIYLISGRIRISEPRTSREMCAGDVMIFAPDRPFSYFKPEGQPMEYYWVHFSGSECAELLEKCEIPVGRIAPAGDHESIRDGFRKLFKAFLSRDSFFEPETSARLGLLLINIGRCLKENGQTSGRNHPGISLCLTAIHDSISRPVSVNELAASEHLSVSQFRAVFKNTTGMSPQEYIILAKLNYSCELLRQTDMSIKEVSMAVGYSDPGYFNRLFVRHFGLTPGAYRLQIINQ